MKGIHILAVGRLKTPCWRAAAEYYAARLARRLSLRESIVKDADARLEPSLRKMLEADRLLKTCRCGEVLVCLDENGESRTSGQFAGFLRALFDAGKTPCFVVGGAYGLDQKILRSAELCLSLGAMTFPHELARVLLLEQVYRADSILAGTGYHH
jgi:23S rRNA (pseudouridine1915-N3)-methyltransferase